MKPREEERPCPPEKLWEEGLNQRGAAASHVVGSARCRTRQTLAPSFRSLHDLQVRIFQDLIMSYLGFIGQMIYLEQ